MGDVVGWDAGAGYDRVVLANPVLLAKLKAHFPECTMRQWGGGSGYAFYECCCAGECDARATVNPDGTLRTQGTGAYCRDLDWSASR